MLNNITAGQYVSGDSVIHALDARVKTVLTAAYLAFIFLADNTASYAAEAVFTAALVIISRIPVRYFIKSLKPVMWILVIMAVINLFTGKGETLISLPFSLTITKEGVFTAAAVSARLILLVIAASLLTLTTPPLMLTDAIESLLKPLEKIRVPARDIAMMMSVAIRFIPVFSEEADRIKKAQTSRGADFESGNIIKRAKAMLPVFIPLFVSAIRRADMLAEAMDARCYGGKVRTRMKEMKLSARDAAAIAVFILFAAAEFAIEF